MLFTITLSLVSDPSLVPHGYRGEPDLGGGGYFKSILDCNMEFIKIQLFFYLVFGIWELDLSPNEKYPWNLPAIKKKIVIVTQKSGVF